MKAKICPDCQNNVFMDKLTVKDIILDCCPQCRGIFYDRGELQKVLGDVLNAETALKKLPADSNSNFICSDCGENMSKASAVKNNLQIELLFCAKCYSSFLRRSELNKIREYVISLRQTPGSALRPKTIIKPKHEAQIAKPFGIDSRAIQSENFKKENVNKTADNKLTETPTIKKQSVKSVFPEQSAAPVNYVKTPFQYKTQPSVKPAINLTTLNEETALDHYSHLNYDTYNEAETITLTTYFFCLITNLPVEVYNPRKYFPYILSLIILINCVIFAYSQSMIFNIDKVKSETRKTAMIQRYSEFNLNYGVVPDEFQTKRKKWFNNLFTHQFLHGGFSHIIGNMYFLWVFGDNVCDIFYDYKNPFVREFSFFGFYLLAGIAGALSHTFFFMSMGALPVIGASGAISGIIGAYMRLFPGAQFHQVIIGIPFKIPSIFYIVFWIGMQLAMAVFLGTQTHISWAGHIGGFLAGFILIDLFIPYKISEIKPDRLY